MGFIFNKVIKPLFRTQKGNWKSRLNEQLDKQIVICKDMNVSSIAMTLDNMVNQIYYYDFASSNVKRITYAGPYNASIHRSEFY